MSITLPLPRQEVPVECCDEARPCSSCEEAVCPEHSEPAPVDCGVNGFTCGDCHERCTSIECALWNAPDEL